MTGTVPTAAYRQGDFSKALTGKALGSDQLGRPLTENTIYDPASELHRRFEIGVTSTGRFHSIDPGKLTMAPYFADICAGRILEGSRH